MDETRVSEAHWVHTSRYLRNADGSFYSNAENFDTLSNKAQPAR